MTLQSTGSQEIDSRVKKLWRCEQEGCVEGSHNDAFYRVYQTSKSRSNLLKNLTDSKISSIIDHLYEKKDCTLEEIIRTMPEDGILNSDTCLNTEVEKKEILRGCILLWLRVNLEEHYDADQGVVKGPFWENNQSLKEAIAARFPAPKQIHPEADTKALLALLLTSKTESAYLKDLAAQVIPQKARWDRLNTAQRFTSWGYFRIRWTNDLQDHLILDDMDDLETPVIHVFHLASYLRSSGAARELLPEGLIKETICSLGLLMWRNRNGPKDWLEMQDKKETRIWRGPLDKLVIKQDFKELGRDLSQYRYWGDRLKQIDHAFKRAKPTSMRQWWVDRRDGAARFPVLIAVAALVLSTLLSLTQVIIQLAI